MRILSSSVFSIGVDLNTHIRVHDVSFDRFFKTLIIYLLPKAIAKFAYILPQKDGMTQA